MKTKLFTPNFTRLLLGQISSLFGNYTLKFAISMYILEQTGSAAVFAGLLALAMLPTILLSPFGGILADRADRRAIMVALDGLSGGCVLAAALLFPGAGGLPVTAGLLVALSVLGPSSPPRCKPACPRCWTAWRSCRATPWWARFPPWPGWSPPFSAAWCTQPGG